MKGKQMQMKIPELARSVTLIGLFLLTSSGNDARAADPLKQADAWHRSGHPNRVAWWARPSNNHRYDGYHVGGGAAYRGDARRPHEGTWGWDHVGGGWFQRRVKLDWWHGRRSQGGTGAYKSDGPRRH